MTERVRLGVNIDHVATIRNARGSDYPDPTRAAQSLTPQERAEVLRAGVPDPGRFDDPKLYQLALYFHTEVQRLHFIA